MSSFITGVIKPIAQWYSEINSATLNGAIDVLVVEQEDGSYLSSPFHVRFGKLGVLKAKEKIVDLEINGEPVDIQMKLDDHGAAFFVDDVPESDEESIPPELATSPIPGASFDDRRIQFPASHEHHEADGEDTPSNSCNRSLIDDFNKASEEAIEEPVPNSMSTGSATKGKLNRKKRKRRAGNHRRTGSKASLKEVLQEELSSESGSDRGSMKNHDDSMTNNNNNNEEIFQLEDNENDGDLDEDDDRKEAATTTKSAAVSAQRKLSNPIANVNNESVISQACSEQSFLQSRLGADIDSILESQDQLEEQRVKAEEQQQKEAREQQNYFSEPEMTPITSPLGSRPSTPVVSDTEYETKKRDNTPQQDNAEWQWGELPGNSPNSSAIKEGADDTDSAQKTRSGERASAAEKRSRTWTFSSLWRNNKSTEKDGAPGLYLDDLKDDEELISLYVGSRKNAANAAGAGASANNPSGNEDDAESGTGPSLPMSPHSVDGAIGGMRNESSDEEVQTPVASTGSKSMTILQKGLGVLPDDIAFSLCGGLVQLAAGASSSETKSPVFSALMFEQSLLSYDDFIMHLRNGEDLFNNTNLVVRMGDQYLPWKAACPIIMSALLYGRTVPGEMMKLIQASYQDSSSSSMNKAEAVSSSPNTKIQRSSSWWPFGSRQPTVSEEQSSAVTVAEDQDISQPEKAAAEAKESTDAIDSGLSETMDDRGIELMCNETDALAEEGDGSPDVDAGRKKYKKTLRLGSDMIKKLGLKFGSNEAQFSVTTAYQGTSRCNCHIYVWKYTDNIVISDIDGTITKSDVLGHVLPIVGRDWAQSGVAQLFTKIVANGYHIVYLSARAIGQAKLTKDYINSVQQGELNLPDGPIFLNPTSLISAFHREVIEKKPEKFKIACLKDIKSLFPNDRNPFYAGYGNRVNDVFAYRAVGIPINRIYTINTRGELRHELTQTFQTSYDCQSSIVDHVFPPRDHEGDTMSPSTQEYSSFIFWKEPIQELSLLQPHAPEERVKSQNKVNDNSAEMSTGK